MINQYLCAVSVSAVNPSFQQAVAGLGSSVTKVTQQDGQRSRCCDKNDGVKPVLLHHVATSLQIGPEMQPTKYRSRRRVGEVVLASRYRFGE